MPIGAIIVVVVAAIVILVAAATAGIRLSAVRQRFGTEYARLAGELGPRRARAELAARRRHVEGLGIHPLTAEQRSAYKRRWSAVQEGFIDDPAAAVNTAAALVAAAQHDRGYPPVVRGQELAALSVHHAGPLPGYRDALVTQDRIGEASTDELRLAMLGFRGLFNDLLADARPASDTDDAGDAGAHDAGAHQADAAMAMMTAGGGMTAPRAITAAAGKADNAGETARNAGKTVAS